MLYFGLIVFIVSEVASVEQRIILLAYAYYGTIAFVTATSAVCFNKGLVRFRVSRGIVYVVNVGLVALVTTMYHVDALGPTADGVAREFVKCSGIATVNIVGVALLGVGLGQGSQRTGLYSAHHDE